MVLKTGMVKEPEKRLLSVFWSDQGPTGGQIGDAINNLINK